MEFPRKTNLKLWNKIKQQVLLSSNGGRPHQWNAMKEQIAINLYNEAGGTYLEPHQGFASSQMSQPIQTVGGRENNTRHKPARKKVKRAKKTSTTLKKHHPKKKIKSPKKKRAKKKATSSKRKTVRKKMTSSKRKATPKKRRKKRA
jgi:hypothetical protein